MAEILSEVLDGADGTARLADRLVMNCARTLPVTGVGLVLMTNSGPAGTVAASDSAALTMEELQFTLGEGPCVESSATGRPVLQPDLARTGPARWPAFSAGAVEAGIRAIFALPLRVGGIRLGVLDLYRAQTGALGAKDLAEALSYADAATTILLHFQTQDASDGDDLEAIPLIEDRAEVHQATGMIAVHAAVTLAQALVLLRARSFASERPILAVARDVVAGVLHFRSGVDGEIRG